MNGNMNMNYNQYPNNGMNNMNPNMGMNNMNMNSNMGMGNNMQQAMDDPIAKEKKAKTFKKLKKLAIFVCIFVVLLCGKKYIDYITIDYKSVVDESLSSYYVSSNIQDLEPIAKLLNKYQKNANIVKKIQNYSYEKVGQWFLYIDKKFVCDEKNYNSCVSQLKEFELLTLKLKSLKDVKGGGYFIILPTAYDALLDEADKKVTSLTTISKNRSYTSPDNSETIYQRKCSSVKVDDDCQCRDGICTCSYDYAAADGSKKIGEVKCYKPETIKEK